ncbi:2'-5' RNA ligase family protein [Altererythrobacter sp. H2]|uniref:2'-5' RNA ligase family protein n=1 Tax=Altererythrobacter sp. H2 TaxID=3108391 RepID=UPI002B4BF3C1|nr:2'-5' RNA ligase family protein [Altererythrobacter sp. H2]WRK94674.1 2'-5' RNA ligase family protein [Altererythrobacter sp. H2]
MVLPPLIVTALLPADLHRWATALRTQHFPPERNYLEAHVTLFHALPPSSEREVRAALAGEASALAPVQARLSGLISLGRGTALRIESPAMLSLRDRLAERFHGILTPQDSHRPRLHVTIQNKVTPAEARTLKEQLEPVIEPRAFAFRGLGLHLYRGGPWEAAGEFPFRGKGQGA